MGCGQGGVSQKDVFGCWWISSEVCDIPGIETHNAWIEWLAKERYAKIRNGQLLSLVPKKINPELIHLKNNSCSMVCYDISFRLVEG